jgi:hypothetical protein
VIWLKSMRCLLKIGKESFHSYSPVLQATVFDQWLANQQSVGLKPLKNLDPTVSIYADLRQNIESVNVLHQQS